MFQAFDRKDKAEQLEAPSDRLQDLRHRRADPARARRRQDAGALEPAQARQHVRLRPRGYGFHSDAGLPRHAGGRCRHASALGLSRARDPQHAASTPNTEKRTQSMEIGQYQPNLDGDGLRIGIVQSRFNEPVCNGLADACIEELERLGVIGQDVLLVTVPGALEIPLALQSSPSRPVRRADRAWRRRARRDVITSNSCRTKAARASRASRSISARRWRTPCSRPKTTSRRSRA